MTKPKAILCIDIDGTLIDSEERVHSHDREILKNFPEEIQPVLTTGRILHSAKGVLQENGLFEDFLFPLPGVFLNGGAAYLPDEVLCTQHPFMQKTRADLINLSQAYPQTAFTFFTMGAVHLINPNPFGKHISRLHFLDAYESQPSALPHKIIKVMVLEEDQQILQQIENDAQRLEAEKAYSLPYAYEINPPGITKAKTLMTLLKTMLMQDLPVFAVGDNENDLSLFEISQACFAPAGSHPTILARADHIIERSKDGLLAPILEQINL